MKLIKLNQKGFGLHAILPVLVILIVSAIGVHLLTASKAAEVTGGGGGGTPTYYNGIIYSGGSTTWWDGTSQMTLSPPSGFANGFSNSSFGGTQVAYVNPAYGSTIYKGTVTYNGFAGKGTLSLSNISSLGSLPSGTLPSSAPMWSPDGTKLAVIISSGTKGAYSNQIWVARTDGSGGHVVPNVPTNIEPYVSWRPGSVNITYVAPYPATGNQICTISTGGLNRACHTIPRGTVQVGGYLGEAGLAVSPDGSKIALADFNYSTTGTATSGDIYTVNSDGSGLKRLSTLPVGEQVNAVVWSPDGKKIAYLLNGNGTAYTKNPTGLYVMNAADGSSKTQIAGNNFFYPTSLSWSIATGK